MIILFSFFYTGFTNTDDQTFNIKQYMAISNARTRLSDVDNVFTNILNIVLVPFLLIDLILFVFIIIGYTFISIPIILTVIILTPMGLLILFDYVIPMLRGN